MSDESPTPTNNFTALATRGKAMTLGELAQAVSDAQRLGMPETAPVSARSTAWRGWITRITVGGPQS